MRGSWLSRFGTESLLSRFFVGMSGQVFSRIVVAAAAVIWVPLMLRAWGVKGYGEWIAITSLGSYLSYSNFGFVTPATNEIVMFAGANKIDDAKQHVRMAISFSLFVVLPVLLVLTIGLSELDFQNRFRFEVLTNAQCAIIIASVSWGLIAQTLLGVVIAPLYAQGMYGRVYFSYSLVRLAELIIISALLWTLRVSPETVAGTTAALGTINLIVLSVLAKRLVPWISFRPNRLNANWISQQIRPTLGFMLYNLATQGILLLGPRVLLSAVLGGGAVVAYTLYGTLMRLVDQVVLVFLGPLELEMARSAGAKNFDQTVKLIRIGSQASWIVFVAISLAVAVFAPLVFPAWTNGQVVFQFHLLALAGVMLGCSHFGRVSASALCATNRMYGPSFLITVCSIVALGVGTLLSTGYGVEGMFFGSILGELGASLIAIYAVASWLDVSIPTLLFEGSTFRSAIAVLVRRTSKA